MNDATTVVGVSALGLVGVVAMTSTAPQLLRRVLAGRRASRLPLPWLVAVSLAQTSLVVVLCAWLGARFGPRLGLLSRLFSPDPANGAWSAALALGVTTGAVGGGLASWWSPPLVAYVRTTPLAVRLLYGGLTEEVIVRWGILSGVGALLLRVRAPTPSTATSATIVLTIVATNVLFAAAHVPLLRATGKGNAAHAAAGIGLASLPWGWLAVTYGLESAMVAHVGFHLAIECLARGGRASRQ